ncbi:PTPS-domain-containing protein [Basidiobolus meristosporus CBS 931.73]|uniref:6-pyruvoyl tetrahydrobiopterin synthase n=1 Tax=Basidiobolus meristosporus CBS 931.73 TaxID=1314790 RepID=A0A1Y1YEN4_9FUNG|nr:PTPS-domain-containing protein [Basidiobolus meristosporus CBS 931.73]|eukprot:ORX96054.1 PTPS-domain-containing protein [Basidiobolus meristosporus CBS 931.73]
MPIAYVCRTASFSAAHRLHSPLLSIEENKEIFGKCNHPNGHGHNYKVEIIIKGEVDPLTGMVINLTELKQIMEVAIMDVLDHKNLDKDVEYFQDKPSTTENLAIFIWKSMQEHITSCQLDEVRVHETDNNTAIFRGEGL